MSLKADIQARLWLNNKCFEFNFLISIFLFGYKLLFAGYSKLPIIRSKRGIEQADNPQISQKGDINQRIKAF